MVSTTVPQLRVLGALVIAIERVLVMHRGRIVEDGPVEQVLLESQLRERLASELGADRG
jgi:ABC-type microcin C transport system duplicated ATPase subunit YejF